jgi:hypothetical protein
MTDDAMPADVVLTREQRRSTLAMRSWRPQERRVVWRGAAGRFVVACEPAAIALLFGAFTVGLAHLAGSKDHQGYIYLAWVFGFGAACFTLYAVGLLVNPIRTLLQTREPIFSVDGYVRTRGPDVSSVAGSSGYIAVMLDDGRVACEWSAHGDGILPDQTFPAFTEFSEYGGIHMVDGQSTGVLPEDIPAFGLSKPESKLKDREFRG